MKKYKKLTSLTRVDCPKLANIVNKMIISERVKKWFREKHVIFYSLLVEILHL